MTTQLKSTLASGDQTQDKSTNSSLTLRSNDEDPHASSTPDEKASPITMARILAEFEDNPDILFGKRFVECEEDGEDVVFKVVRYTKLEDKSVLYEISYADIPEDIMPPMEAEGLKLMLQGSSLEGSSGDSEVLEDEF